MSGDDVRMRGFRARAELSEALELLRETAVPLPAESVPVTACAGRVLAADLHAPIDVPGFRRAAVDGYAIRGEDSFAASEHNPILLEVLGTSLPGRPCAAAVGEGQAVRITTGAPLPAGADAVLQAELARAHRRGGREQVELLGTVAPLRHIGELGEDLARGQLVLPAGRRLRPQDAAVLASLGLADISARRRPRVQLLVTGDELVPPGTPPGPWQIVDSNSVLLAALAARDGADVLPTLRARDGEAALTAGFNDLSEGPADVLLVAGATSVGLEDLMPQVLARAGALEIHGIAVRPASPTGVGRLHDGAEAGEQQGGEDGFHARRLWVWRVRGKGLTGDGCRWFRCIIALRSKGREMECIGEAEGSMSEWNLPDAIAFARASCLHALDSFTPPPGVRY